MNGKRTCKTIRLEACIEIQSTYNKIIGKSAGALLCQRLWLLRRWPWLLGWLNALLLFDLWMTIAITSAAVRIFAHGFSYSTHKIGGPCARLHRYARQIMLPNRIGCWVPPILSHTICVHTLQTHCSCFPFIVCQWTRLARTNNILDASDFQRDSLLDFVIAFVYRWEHNRHKTHMGGTRHKSIGQIPLLRQRN